MYHFYNDWVSVTKIEYQRLIPEVLLNQYFWLSRVAIGLALASDEPGVVVNVYILLPLMAILSCTLLISKKLQVSTEVSKGISARLQYDSYFFKLLDSKTNLLCVSMFIIPFAYYFNVSIIVGPSYLINTPNREFGNTWSISQLISPTVTCKVLIGETL